VHVEAEIKAIESEKAWRAAEESRGIAAEREAQERDRLATIEKDIAAVQSRLADALISGSDDSQLKAELRELDLVRLSAQRGAEVLSQRVYELSAEVQKRREDAHNAAAEAERARLLAELQTVESDGMSYISEFLESYRQTCRAFFLVCEHIDKADSLRESLGPQALTVRSKLMEPLNAPQGPAFHLLRGWQEKTWGWGSGWVFTIRPAKPPQ
jgi:hypothetical protein